MQFWPRVRASRIYPRIRSWPEMDKLSFLGFPTYKVGMTHIIGIDNTKTSATKGEEIFVPATILECPPIRILSIRFYKKTLNSQKVAKEIMFKPLKDVSRKIPLPKKFSEPKDLDKIAPEEYHDITAVIYTQPRLIKKKKTPEILELRMGGKVEEKLAFLKERVGKDLKMSDVFEEGNYVDAHAITTGKGTQGPVKRFGVAIRSHKSEKTKRGPGSLGGWKGQAHFMYRIAFAGQTGYHQRLDFNKQILRLSNEVDKINPKGGFPKYGLVNSEYLLLSGSTPGPVKRLIMLTVAQRSKSKKQIPDIQYIATTK